MKINKELIKYLTKLHYQEDDLYGFHINVKGEYSFRGETVTSLQHLLAEIAHYNYFKGRSDKIREFKSQLEDVLHDNNPYEED